MAKTFIDMLKAVAYAVWYWLLGAVGLYILLFIVVWLFRKAGAQIPEATFEKMGEGAQNLGALAGCWLFFKDNDLFIAKYAILAKAVGAGVSSFIATINFVALLYLLQSVTMTAEAKLESSLFALVVGTVGGIKYRRRLIEHLILLADMEARRAAAGEKKRPSAEAAERKE